MFGLYAEAFSRLSAQPKLRRSLTAWCTAGLVLSMAYAAAVALLAPGGRLAQALLLTALWWVLICVVFTGGASMLDTPGGERVDHYGVPNGLTGLRAWMCMPVLLTALFDLPGREGLALFAGVGGAAGMLDAVDGVVARSVGPVTRLGKALDPFMDTLFFLVAAAGSYALGIVPLWLAALIAFRYAGPVLLTPFVFLARRRPELVHTRWGRRNTILTGFVLFVLFIVDLAAGPVWLAALVTALPLLVPTLVLHFVSLAARVRSAPLAAR